MKIIDEQLISGVVEQAKQSPRLRMNYNFHESLQDKCHRFLNALEPGTFIPVHHHPDKEQMTYVYLSGAGTANWASRRFRSKVMLTNDATS